MLFPLSFISAETVEFRRYGFIYIERCFAFLSEMILSFLYPQFNIDGYIPDLYVSLPVILPFNLEYLNDRFLFFIFTFP